MALKHGEYMEYGGRYSKTIPTRTVVRVKRETSCERTIVEAMNADGCLVNLVLATKNLKVLRSLV